MFYHSAYWKNCKMLTELTVHHHITHYQVKLWRCVNLSSYNVTHALRNNFELLKPHPDRGSLRLQKFSVTNREPLPLHKLSVTHSFFSLMLNILLLTKSRTKTPSFRRTISCLDIALVASGRWIEKKRGSSLMLPNQSYTS